MGGKRGGEGGPLDGVGYEEFRDALEGIYEEGGEASLIGLNLGSTFGRNAKEYRGIWGVTFEYFDGGRWGREGEPLVLAEDKVDDFARVLHEKLRAIDLSQDFFECEELRLPEDRRPEREGI